MRKLLFVLLLSISTNLFSQVLLPTVGENDRLISLNGLWKFKYLSGSKIGVDSCFFLPTYDVSSWSNIKTPGNWEMQGFAEPTYGKVLVNGMGLYRTPFTVPENWKNNRIYIAFDGVQSGYSFWVNGQLAGSFSSSFNRETFDVSRLVVPGKTNTLAVKVLTQPKGWEFDTNDDWSLSGIFRDVTLFSLPPIHIKDVILKTFVNAGRGSIDVQTIIEKPTSAAFPKSLTMDGKLLDATGKTIQTFSLKPAPSKNSAMYFSERITVESPNCWSAESPYLYTLQLTLRKNKKELQRYTDHVGIREVTWTDGILKLNGVPIKLKGVNHHDLSPINGRAITGEELLQNLQWMAKANINFIRTSHYPPSPRLLELCDSLGFYVMDEVPYGFGDQHLTKASYLPLLLQRAKSTVWRDKNRPCVIAWSVGNENPVTDIGLKTGRSVKSMDDTRPYCFPQYPSEFEKMLKSMPDSLDVLDDHYATASDLLRYVKTIDRPLILGEYAHALGLDFNSMEAVYETMYAQPKLAGGAVWAFLDQGILRKATKPVQRGEPTLYAWTTPDSMFDTSGNQGADGILYANRVPQTDYFQVRKVYTPVKALDDTLLYQPGKQTYRFRLNNRFDFTNLSEVACTWMLIADTVCLDSGRLALNVPPHDTSQVEVQVVLPDSSAANFYCFKLVFEHEKRQIYEKTYPLVVQNQTSLLNRMAGSSKMEPIKRGSTIEALNYRLELSKDSAGIQLYSKNGALLISNGPFARVGRKPSVSQLAAQGKVRPQVQHTLWSPFVLEHPTLQVKSFDSKQLLVHARYSPEQPKNRTLAGDISYRFSDNGAIQMQYHLVANGSEEATETGLSFVIPATYTEFRWVGKGPYAAYPGKDRLSEFGMYHLNSNDLYFSGNRQNTSLALFTNADGNGFALLADQSDISVERTEAGILVSQNASVSGRFNKYDWPTDLFMLNSPQGFGGSFQIFPFTYQTQPAVLKELFGDLKQVAKAYQPFYHSYDQ